MQNSLEKLAGVIESVCLARIPDTILEKIKSLIIDSIACMVGGTRVEEGRKMIDFYEKLGGPPQATVAAKTKKLPRYFAASVNAYLANLLDFDDTYYGHPGSSVIPTGMACGEFQESRGRDFLESITAGYEVGLRVTSAILPSPGRLKVVRGTSTFQIFASAATAGKLLGLDKGQLMHALAMAGFHAPVPSIHKSGTEQQDICPLKNNLGWANLGAMISADLAKSGFQGNTTLFDGEKGFWIMAGSDQYQPSRMLDPEGGFYLEKVQLKPYSACRFLHSSLNAADLLVRENRFHPEEIERIEVETFSLVREKYSFYPRKILDIPFSLPYVLAMILMGMKTGYGWHDEAKLRDERIKRLADKILIIPWKEADTLYSNFPRKLASRVSVTLKGGSVFRQEVRDAKGDPSNPMSREELKEKAYSLIEPVLGLRSAENLYDAVLNLERMEKIATLAKLLRPRRERAFIRT